MAWVRTDDQMTDHPKIEPLSDAAFRWIHRGLGYANRFLTNGVLPPRFVAKVPPTVLQELSSTQDGQKSPVWYVQSDHSVRIHDYKDYQPTKSEIEKERKRNRERQKKWRESHGSNTVTTTGTNGAPSRPVPSRSNNPPVVPQGGRGRARKSRFSETNPDAVQQALDTQRRRAEMTAAGMSDAEIEAVFDREYDERRRAR